MIDKFSKALVTMFGVGYFKYAPGTAASLFTCVIWYLFAFSNFVSNSRGVYWNFSSYYGYALLILILITFYSIIVIDNVFKKKDAPEIVIDEVVGQSIPLIFYFSYMPAVDELSRFDTAYWLYGSTQIYMSILLWIVLSFLFFRFFDIEKPPPIDEIDNNIKNGVGVMLDDIVAGFYTCIPVLIIHDLVMYMYHMIDGGKRSITSLIEFPFHYVKHFLFAFLGL